MKFRLIFVLALLLAGTTASAAELSTSGGSQVYSNDVEQSRAPVQLTQNNNVVTIQPVQVACGDAGTNTKQNWYLRRFHLFLDHGISDPLTVQSVRFGVEQLQMADGNPPPAFDVNLVLFEAAAGSPDLFANMNPIAQTLVTITQADVGTFMTIPIAAVIADPVNTDLWVAIDAPDGTNIGAGLQFRPGANSLGAIRDAYIAAQACGIANPVQVSSIGFPDSQTVFVVNGDVSPPTGPGACCFDEVCAVLTEDECLQFGGGWRGYPSCQPNPCRPPDPGACCSDGFCQIMFEEECMSIGWTWDGFEQCQPNPCPIDPIVGPACPPGGLDRFDDTHAAFLFDVPGAGLGPKPVIANGPTTVLRRARIFDPSGSCTIETEILELSLTGIFDPDICNGLQLPVTINLVPTAPTLGAIVSSDDGAGNPSYPDASSFNVIVEIDIPGLGGPFLHTINDLGTLLNSGDLWGDPPCILPTDPYRPPSNDHAHIPCPDDQPPEGCCILPPEVGGGMFETNQTLCESVGGTYQGDNVPCPPCPQIGACCFDEVCAILSPGECAAFGGVWNGSPSCQPNPCRELGIPGACCSDGICQIVPEDVCMTIQWTWDGAGSCSPNPCPVDPIVGPACPPGGLDRFDDTHAAFVFDAPGAGLGPLPIVASGPTSVLRRTRNFFPDGHCEIETEIVELSLTGIYDPNECDGQQRPVTITLAPGIPTLGTISSGDNGAGDPDFPNDSFFDVFVEIDIDGVGVFTHTVAGLGNLLDNGDLWGDPPCILPTDPYRPPSNDHAHIPCPDEDPPTGCCVLPPAIGGGMFVTNEAICDELGGTYLGDGTDCPCPQPGACCFDQVCALLLPNECAVFGGTWDGSASCSPNPCRDPEPGACCLSGGSCVILFETDCIVISGTWDGAPFCSPNPCPDDPTVGPACPPGGLDRFDDTHAAFLFDAPGDGLGPRAVIAAGPTTVLRRVRTFDPSGSCTIETEMLQLSLTGVFNPDCRDPENQHPVTITLDPNAPTLGTISSGDNGAGDPAFPDDSSFDVNVEIDIDGVGVFSHTVAGLGALLDNGDLWGDPPCIQPNDPYRPPSNDHAHIPCPPEGPPEGCCVMPPELGNAEFITNETICDLLGGAYQGDGTVCDCDPSAIDDPPDGVRDFGLTEIVPNPSTGDVRISYQLSAGAATRIDIYDASGRSVRSIPMGAQAIGEHVWVWDGRDDRGRSLPTGVFFVTLQSGSQRTTREVVLIR